jgi:hypothetical protein
MIIVQNSRIYEQKVKREKEKREKNTTRKKKTKERELDSKNYLEKKTEEHIKKQIETETDRKNEKLHKIKQ